MSEAKIDESALGDLLCDDDGNVHSLDVFMVGVVLLLFSAGIILVALSVGFYDSRFFYAGTILFITISIISYFGNKDVYKTGT